MRGEDRLSDLPEAILHHIFSFLPTSQIFFTTHSLSKKWANFSTSFPHLLFNIYSHDAEAFADNFMSRLALRRNLPDIQSFRLRWSSSNYKALICVEQWIAMALYRNVRELDIYLGHGLTIFTVPAEIFAAASSVKVIKLESLFYGDSFMVPRPMLSSPNLKTLELIKIKLPKGDSNGEAILGCPVLETLILKQCHYSHLKVLNLSVNRLNHLEIDNSAGADRFLRITGIGDCKLHLNTPNLSSFVYKGVLFKECSFGNLVVLVDVQLFLCPPFVKEHVKFLQALKGARPVPLKGIEDSIVQMREQMSQPNSGTSNLTQVHEAQLFYSTVSGVGLKGRRVYGLESQQALRYFYNVPWASSSQRPSARPVHNPVRSLSYHSSGPNCNCRGCGS